MTPASTYLESHILAAWRRVAERIGSCNGVGFSGRGKETAVFRQLRQEIEYLDKERSFQLTGPDSQVRFNSWSIDLVCSGASACVAVEGKYKLISDGAVPDNRKAAFQDLHKLEQYVRSGAYFRGLFLWLTNEPGYLRVAAGDSADFSTHEGRRYHPGSMLAAKRCRDSSMPLPLVLSGSYLFNWEKVLPNDDWYSLALSVPGAG